MSDLSSKKFTYSNGEISILWQPGKCIHSGICARGLPTVFKPREKPWIQMEGEESSKMVLAVSKCPSGALSIIKDK